MFYNRACKPYCNQMFSTSCMWIHDIIEARSDILFVHCCCFHYVNLDARSRLFSLRTLLLWLHHSHGVLIDLVCMVNIFMKDHLYTQKIHQDTYDKFDVVIKVHDGFTCLIIGFITLLVEVGTKCLDVTFVIVPT